MTASRQQRVCRDAVLGAHRIALPMLMPMPMLMLMLGITSSCRGPICMGAEEIRPVSKAVTQSGGSGPFVLFASAHKTMGCAAGKLSAARPRSCGALSTPQQAPPHPEQVPLTKPEDFDGLTLRVIPDPVHAAHRGRSARNSGTNPRGQCPALRTRALQCIACEKKARAWWWQPASQWVTGIR